MSKDCYKKTTNVTIKGRFDVIDEKRVVVVEGKTGNQIIDIDEALDTVAGDILGSYNIQLILTDEEDYSNE